MNRLPFLYIADSPKGGRGVFTAREIPPDSTIEICPVIVLPPEDVPLIHRTRLHDYYFLWEDEQCAIALGFGSLYNHAGQPNADYKMDYEEMTIDLFSLRLIEAGEEITINYTDSEEVRTKLWFEER